MQVKMILDTTIMSWNYDGKFYKLHTGKTYTLPDWVANVLQEQGYCAESLR